MFAAQPGIVARYGPQRSAQEGELLTRETTKPVVAFTDDGVPMVVGDEESGHNKKLISADTYKNYVGISYHPVVVGPLGLHRNMSSSGDNESNSAPNGETEEVRSSELEYRTVASMTQWEIAAVEFVALRALELAGKRQLTANRRWRGELRDVPAWEIHTHVLIPNVDKSLWGAFDLLRVCLPGHDDVYRAIDEYVRERIATQRLHDPRRLLTVLADAGCLAKMN